MTQNSTERIQAFIAQEILFEDEASASGLNSETPLLGTIDSLGLLQLVAFLEEEFGIDIAESEITADNFRTAGDVDRLVQQKLSPA
jgi:acyl carrier protein